MAQTISGLSDLVAELKQDMFRLRLRDEQRERELAEVRTELGSFKAKLRYYKLTTKVTAGLVVASGAAAPFVIK